MWGARGAFGEVALWGKVPFGMGLPSLGGDLGVPTALPRPGGASGGSLRGFGVSAIEEGQGSHRCLSRPSSLTPLRLPRNPSRPSGA